MRTLVLQPLTCIDVACFRFLHSTIGALIEELAMSTPADPAQIAAELPGVLAERSRAAFWRLLAADVRWGGQNNTEQTCHNRGRAADFYDALLAGGARLTVLHTSVDGDKVRARLEVNGPGDGPDLDYQTEVQLTVRGGLVVDILQMEDDESPTIELLYFTGCPNHTAFLPHLQQLLDSNDVNSPVQLIEVSDDEAHRLRFLGSPSLRINGHDIEPEAEDRSTYGLQCRVYSTPDGPVGAPADSWILAALQA